MTKDATPAPDDELPEVARVALGQPKALRAPRTKRRRSAVVVRSPDRPREPRLFDPVGALAGAMLARSLPRGLRSRIRRGEPLFVIVETPTAAWAEPLAEVARDIFRHAQTMHLSAAKRHSAGVDVSLIDTPMMGFAPQRDLFHPSVVAAADMVVTAKLTPAVVGRAIETCCKTREPVSAADIAGLDFHDLCLALRPGSTANAAVERLARSSSARRTTIKDGGPGLNALVGYGAALAEIRRIAADLARVRDGRLPGRLLPSVLLWGAPGVGKTQLVRALARTAGAPLVTTTVSHWFSGSPTGLTPVLEKARAFFEQAASSAPCVAFIDEIDGLPDRARVDSQNRDYWTPIVTEVLTLIDRTRRRGGVLLVAATNRPDDLDAALRRAGRFDRHIEIVRPQTDKEIAAIFRAYLGADLKEADLSTIARAALARQATGAVVEAWVSAARELARARRRPLTLADLSAIVLPPAKMSSENEAALALHECAHAVAGRALGIGVPLVSIVAAGRSLGRASFDFGEGPLTRNELERHVTAGLAGRAADELFSGDAEAGAMGDLREATRMVAGIHRVLGLGAKLSSRGVLETADEMLALDPDLARLVESELQRLMGDARRLVRDCEPAIRALAQTLLAQRVVDQRAIDAALARSGVRAGSARLGARP